MIKFSLLRLKIVPKISELSDKQNSTKTEKHERGKSRWALETAVGRPAWSTRQSNWQIAVGLGRPVGRPDAKGEITF